MRKVQELSFLVKHIRVQGKKEGINSRAIGQSSDMHTSLYAGEGDVGKQAHLGVRLSHTK